MFGYDVKWPTTAKTTCIWLFSLFYESTLSRSVFMCVALPLRSQYTNAFVYYSLTHKISYRHSMLVETNRSADNNRRKTSQTISMLDWFSDRIVDALLEFSPRTKMQLYVYLYQPARHDSYLQYKWQNENVSKGFFFSLFAVDNTHYNHFHVVFPMVWILAILNGIRYLSKETIKSCM